MRKNKFIRALIIVNVIVLMLMVPVVFGSNRLALFTTDHVSASIDQDSELGSDIGSTTLSTSVASTTVSRSDVSTTTTSSSDQTLFLIPAKTDKGSIVMIPDSKKTTDDAKPSAPRKVAFTIPDKVSASQATKVLHKVAKCESENKPWAESKLSSAKGLLQILDGTWDTYQCAGNVFDADDNFACGVKIATKSGLHNWDESRACWSKLITASDFR